MNDLQLKITIGGLLHDIGKILYRSSDGRNHSQSGYEFLKDQVKLQDQDILDQVHYHHAALLKDASLPVDSLAYITYMADNIAAATDRRETDDGMNGFDKTMALESIFNILNNNDEHKKYPPGTLARSEGINYPTDHALVYDEAFYKKIVNNVQDVLKQLDYSEMYVNSLLETLEANLTYIPSSTSKKEKADISLYDHMKITAAIGICIYAYLAEKDITDYKTCLFSESKAFYKEKAFLLYSMDMSGIQAFIYNIQSEKALKSLRSRSFYLEIMLENLVDDLCQTFGVSRTNLIYSGGGHAYLLLPNTENIRSQLDAFETHVNQWMLRRFQTELYVACGYAACNAEDLQNSRPGSYRQIFYDVSQQLSIKKMQRYSSEHILYLNSREPESGVRECKICHRSDHLQKDSDLCEICSGLIYLSRGIQEKQFFSVDTSPQEQSIPLMAHEYLAADTEEELQQRMRSSAHYLRTYCKNKMYTGYGVATKLWVGDYKSADTFEELVDAGTGINRLGVLRADIDNLGQAFVRGFESDKNGDHYVSLSRTAAFSRKLSLFFKLHINDILAQGDFSINGKQPGKRNAAVVYSGGDDVFVVGAWKDMLEFSVDFYQALRKFSQGTLTISAGLGLFSPKYPISAMADETGALEDAAKGLEGKNGIALFDENIAYHWEELIHDVIGEKFNMIYEFFEGSNKRGKNFLYNLLELLRGREDNINIARLAYLLARMEPDRNANEDKKQQYRTFSRKMYAWGTDSMESKKVITAIYIYAYLVRQEEE